MIPSASIGVIFSRLRYDEVLFDDSAAKPPGIEKLRFARLLPSQPCEQQRRKSGSVEGGHLGPEFRLSVLEKPQTPSTCAGNNARYLSYSATAPRLQPPAGLNRISSTYVSKACSLVRLMWAAASRVSRQVGVATQKE